MDRKMTLRGVCAAAALALVFLASAPTSADNGDNAAGQKLDQIAGKIQGYLNLIDAAMTKSAQDLGKGGIFGQKARAALKGLCSKWPTQSLMCFTTDTKGTISSIAPDSFSSYEGTDISVFSHVREMLSARKPAVSDAFRMPKGEIAISYEWPVVSPSGEFLGAVNALSDPISAIDEVIMPELGADTTNVWIVATDGEVVYSRYHEEIGKDPVIVPSSAGSSLPKLLKQIAATPSGTGTLKTPSVGHAGGKSQQCVWKTVNIRDVERRVVVLGARSSD